MLEPASSRALSLLRAVTLVVIAVAAMISAVSGILTVYSLGALMVELRQDRADTALIRTRLMTENHEQTEVFRVYMRESSKLATAICDHITRVDRLHKPCP